MLSIVIPVFNEIGTLAVVLAKVSRVLPHVPKQIIVVDDYSSDGTREWLTRNVPEGSQSGSLIDVQPDGDLQFSPDTPTITVQALFHPVNKGKGAALRTAFAAVQGDIVVIQDADMEYDPLDWQPMYKLIAEQKFADVVYGVRFRGNAQRSLAYHHYLANRLISEFFSLCFNQKLSDVETCYKMMTRNVLQTLHLTASDFGIEIEITAQIARQRSLRIYEVPVNYHARTYAEGKKINWRDGLLALWYIIKFRFAG